MKIFTLYAPPLPDPVRHVIRNRMTLLYYRRLPGILGIGYAPPTGPGETGGVMLMFGSRTHAEKAQAEMACSGYAVGQYIMNAEQDPHTRTVRVLDPVDGWDSVDPADLIRGTDGKPVGVMCHG